MATETTPQTSYSGDPTYAQYGWNTQTSGAYNASAFDMTSDAFNEGYTRYLRTNHVSDDAKHYAQYIENYKQAYQSYINWYTNNYNNEANSTARQIAAGYNPNFQGGAAGSPAEENKGALQYDTNAGLEAATMEANTINGIVQSSLGTLISLGNAIAGIDKTTAEADLVRQSTPIRLSNDMEEGISKYLQNNKSVIDLYGNGDKAIPTNLVGSGAYLKAGDELDSEGKSYFQYRNDISKWSSGIKEQLLERMKYMKDNGEWSTSIKMLKAAADMDQYDANMSNMLNEFLDSNVKPLVLKGYQLDDAKLDVALKQAGIDLDDAKHKRIREIARDYISMGADLLQTAVGVYNAKSGRFRVKQPNVRNTYNIQY